MTPGSVSRVVDECGCQQDKPVTNDRRPAIFQTPVMSAVGR